MLTVEVRFEELDDCSFVGSSLCNFQNDPFEFGVRSCKRQPVKLEEGECGHRSDALVAISRLRKAGTIR